MALVLSEHLSESEKRETVCAPRPCFIADEFSSFPFLLLLPSPLPFPLRRASRARTRDSIFPALREVAERMAPNKIVTRERNSLRNSRI